MNSKRIAVLAGVIGVVSALVKVVPEALLGGLFEQEPPGWIPMFGTAGQTVLLYSYGTDIIGTFLMVIISVGFGYYATRQLDLRYEYQQFFKAVAAGTTVPLIITWTVVIGGFALGSLSGFNVAIITAMILQLFATISLPVIVGIFAGAAFAHFSEGKYPPSERDETTSTV